MKYNASVNEIWEILKDPENMPAWNPKCRDCRGVPENIVPGSCFEAIFVLGGKSNNAFCEVADYRPSEKITIRFSGPAFKTNRNFVDETFLFIPKSPRRCLVRHEVDFSYSGLPFIIKFLMWFIHMFGFKAGPGPLDGIRDLLEYNEE